MKNNLNNHHSYMIVNKKFKHILSNNKIFDMRYIVQ